MNLFEIAYSSQLYDDFTDYGSSYAAFCGFVDNQPDLTRADHRDALIKWLNQWGCRQFALNHHDLAQNEILAWYKADVGILPVRKHLWELSAVDYQVIEASYDRLASRTASFRSKKDKKETVAVGPTGASKILFAIEPCIYVPWDEAMREGLGFSGSGRSYIGYLKRVLSEIESLANSCLKNNVELLDVPILIGRPQSTIPQLIGEYFWVTLTKGCAPPSIDVIKSWARWGL